jgi:hypothetical protein
MKTYQVHLRMPVAFAALWILPIITLAGENKEPLYRLTVKDVPSAKHFEITLQSYDQRPMCLHTQRWPNEFGEVHFGRSWVALHSAAGLYRAIDENGGRCVGPTCILHIAPKGILRGIISYTVFGNAIDVAALKRRRLEVDVRPRLCTAPEFQEVKTGGQGELEGVSLRISARKPDYGDNHE